MPPKQTSKPSSKAKRTTAGLDDYLLDDDFSDFDVRSPTPPADSARRKEASGLGIDEEVEVKKRAYVPRVKLDETRLLSKAGIPTLKQRAKQLRLKGKGHEWSDASRLLSLYQLWLDDLFPKAKFLDALAMVEKAGHKTGVVKARLEWIDEGKPKTASMFDVDEEDHPQEAQEAREPSRIAPIFERAKPAEGVAVEHRLRTPDIPDDEDLFGDGGIYNATPRAKTAHGASSGGKLDEDDLDALMAEAETTTDAASSTNMAVKSIFGGPASEGPSNSLFGAGPETQSALAGPAPGELDDDDLDALMAEAEQDAPEAKPTTIVGKPERDNFADDEEAMAEMDGLW
ncbi:chromosome segregation in meiosis protein 3 [Coniochaeta pulveracea]|uniref:Chromosome segregation in meiosis protein n=1 Tax=Coniochaeta pulveracea TaxID=177199 RepID=A0A420Y3W9_9PEZI|nr:chromosome segregation in meiosis protein 3 [Coniochaeta pulveracea]